MKIENQAMMFAFLSRAAIEARGEEGRAAIQEGMKRYGRERGARMAARALANGDPVELWTNQAYGEWKPDYPGQMEFGQLCTEPTLVTYISRCAWCDAWKKYGILEYGREYCVNVDAAVYEGFNLAGACIAGCGAADSGTDEAGAAAESGCAVPCGETDIPVCTPLTTSMSWGGDRCDFDWGRPLSEADLKKTADKKAELGTSAMKDFDYHTAHIYYTITDVLRQMLPEDAESVIARAVGDFTGLYGEEDWNRIREFADEQF